MTKKVLLADDEEGILALVSATLGNGEYRILVARDGEEALSIAQREKPALLFLDVLMPKMDGYEVCRVLKRDPTTSHIKVIILTAMAQESDKRKAVEAGADDYFTKPFNPTALLQKVDQVLGLN